MESTNIQYPETFLPTSYFYVVQDTLQFWYFSPGKELQLAHGVPDI